MDLTNSSAFYPSLSLIQTSPARSDARLGWHPDHLLIRSAVLQYANVYMSECVKASPPDGAEHHHGLLSPPSHVTSDLAALWGKRATDDDELLPDRQVSL